MIKRLLFLCVVVLISCSKDEDIEEEVITTDKSARIVGYLPSYRFELNNNIEYCKLTHLNLAFANPGSNGKLIINDFSDVVLKARNDNNNIKIYISIGGGYLTNEQASIWSNLIDVKENRPTIVNELVSFVVDVDVYERIRKFSECQTGSEQRAFIVQGEDAYRGRLPRTPPCFSGAFSPVRARMGPRPIKARPFEPNGCRRGGEEARGRSGPVEKSPQPTSTHSLQPEGGSVPPVAYARSWPCLQQSYGYM